MKTRRSRKRRALRARRARSLRAFDELEAMLEALLHDLARSRALARLAQDRPLAVGFSVRLPSPHCRRRAKARKKRLYRLRPLVETRTGPHAVELLVHAEGVPARGLRLSLSSPRRLRLFYRDTARVLAHTVPLPAPVSLQGAVLTEKNGVVFVRLPRRPLARGAGALPKNPRGQAGPPAP